MMKNERYCIICDATKPESEFERVGEHIIPESLGNRVLITKHVCKNCNKGLGGTVDYSLKKHFNVSQSCHDRNVSGAKNSPFVSRIGVPDSVVDLDDIEFKGFINGLPIAVMGEKNKGAGVFENSILLEYVDTDGSKKFLVHHLKDNMLTPEIQGAMLKIAYEVTHKYLGDKWLADEMALAMRKILYAYASGKKKEAEKLIESNKQILKFDVTNLYKMMQTTREFFVNAAIADRTCVNSLWFIPFQDEKNNGTAIAFDIEGLPPGLVIISYKLQCKKPILILPNKKENL